VTRFQVPGTLRSVPIGPLRVSYVPDGAVKMEPQFLFPDTTVDDWAANSHYLDADGWLTISSGGLLVERDDRAILLESGFGPYPAPTSNPDYGIALMYGGALIDNLRKLGREPRDIEAIAISHLHVEHFGWAAQPEFAHTAVLLSAVEWAERRTGFGVTEEVVAALSPRFRAISDGEEVFPGVTALALPGHTPGQMGFELDGGEVGLLVFADAMHSPIQVTHPEWTLAGDPDKHQAMQTRKKVLSRLADDATIGFGIHFADVGFGRPIRTADVVTWKPLS
jgi:glyoxylase-like metal-dependent hydrolase (beta-lactamase superfamily II)